MSNYNSTLQSNNSDLQTVLQTLQTKAAGSPQATPVISVNTSGLITATAGTKTSTHQLAFQPAKTITPSTASQIAISSGYYTGGVITVAAIPSSYVKPTTTKSATTYTPTTSNQTIAAGTYLTGTQTIAGDADLVADNIKSGVNIFGVTGTYVGSGGGDTSAEDSIITKTISSYTNDRVTTIGNSTFYSCVRLTTASFPAATTIGDYAFYYCISLTTISFPAATTINGYAFGRCSSLTTVNFPAATFIGYSAFYSCSKLTTASFPVATSIGDSAFYSCSKLTTVSFPKVEIIGGSAFYSCSSLTTVSFPAAKTIRGYAFYGCRSLTTISFPAATTIYGSVFYGCYNLKSLYLTGSSLCRLSNSKTFTSTPIGGYSTSAGTYGSIYVPASLLASYKAATNWTYFSSRFVGI